MISTSPLISKSSNPCINPLVTVPSAPITVGITVTFMFHSFSLLSFISIIIIYLKLQLSQQIIIQLNNYLKQYKI